MLTRVHPGPAETLDLDAPESRARLLEWYRPADAEWLRINLVVSVTGSAAGSDGTSETLTSRADRRILGVIRELADVVLVGAASVRAEGYQVPTKARLAVVTSTGDLSGHRLAPDLVEKVTVIGPAAALVRASAELPGAHLLEVPGEGRVSPADAVQALRAAGSNSIVCEGGPSLAGQLIAAGLVDELCLTTSPKLTTVRVTPFAGELGDRALDLGHVLVDDGGSVFARWLTRAG
jgi:riboflavin biosynthesis pyrimidine reductase